MGLSAFSYDAVDIKNAISKQDMQDVKTAVQKMIPKIEKMHDEALERVKSIAGDLINPALIPTDMKKIDTFEMKQKLEELDLDIIKGELEFLAESDLLTNLVNMMEKHWDQVKEAAGDLIDLENEVGKKEVGVVRERREVGADPNGGGSQPQRFHPLAGLISFVFVLLILGKVFGAGPASAAVSLNSNIGMGLLVLFV